VRNLTERLAEPLAVEDYVVQSMPDVSPTKWHLAHVTWFFETFVLTPHLAGYVPLDPAYQFLFNSYYLGAGERHCRAQRGYISRPTVAEVYEYRAYVDKHMARLFLAPEYSEDVARVVEIGLHHEQQHQELLLTDIKHVLGVNPLRPAYLPAMSIQREPKIQLSQVSSSANSLRWIPVEGGLYEIGRDPAEGFAFDNEMPCHRTFVEPFELGHRLVTNGDFLTFMDDGGYQRGDLWLSEGWALAQSREWLEPFYWEKREGTWMLFTLHGMKPVDPAEPLVHINYFEADAFARWAGARLPTEQEWEIAANQLVKSTGSISGNFVGSQAYHPEALGVTPEPDDLEQMFGDVWEWTRSQYSPYPGYTPLPGTLGEYNGKFMSNQFILRGGSCATSQDHFRTSYRNFFPGDASWQFTGLRLARDA